MNNEPGRDLSSVLDRHPQVEVVTMPENLGWSGAQQRMMARSAEEGYEFHLMMNTDIRIARDDLIERLVRPFDLDERCGLVSPVVLQDGTREDRLWFQGGTFDQRLFIHRHPGLNRTWRPNPATSTPRVTEVINGCCALVSHRVLDEVGGLDPLIFLYGDEVDYCLRARRAGFRCYVVPEALLHHSKPGRKLNGIEAYYFARNPLYLIRKHVAGMLARAVAVAGQLVICLPYNMARCRGLRARLSYLRGLGDGLRVLLGESRMGRGRPPLSSHGSNRPRG